MYPRVVISGGRVVSLFRRAYPRVSQPLRMLTSNNQSQRSPWLRRFLYGVTTATTATAIAVIYTETFDWRSSLPGMLESSRSEPDDFNPFNAVSEWQPFLPRRHQEILAVVDLERVELLVPAVEEIIEVGGTTWFYQRQQKNGDKVWAELHDLEEASYYAVTIQNTERFRERVEELQFFSGELFPFIAQRIIDKCTSHGSYSLLKILNEEHFGLTDLLGDNVILHHPKAEMIESALDKFHKLGLLKQDHMPLILAIQEQQALEAARDRSQVEMLISDPSDAVEIMQAYLDCQKQLTKATSRIKEDFSHVVALPEEYFIRDYTEYDNKHELFTVGSYNFLRTSSQEKYDKLFKSLKHEASAGKGPVNASGLLCGAHFTQFSIQISKQENGRFRVRLLHIDSMSAHPGSFTGSTLVPSILRVFGDNADIELYASTEYTQSAGSGCSYHAPFVLERMRELPQWLAAHVDGYADLPYDERVWKYLEENKDFTDDIVINMFDDLALYHQEKFTEKPKTSKVRWHGSTLPLHVTAENKETFSKATNLNDDRAVVRESAAPHRVIDSYDPGDILSQQGLKVNLRPGAPRAHQQHLPVRIGGPSFNEALASHTVTKPIRRKDGTIVLKKLNRGVDIYREKMRKDLLQFLLEMPAEELDQLTGRFTIEEFEFRACEQHLSTAGTFRKACRQTFFTMTKEATPKPDESSTYRPK